MARDKCIIEAEQFSVSTEQVDGEDDRVVISGKALPFGKPSRNGIQYTKESVKETADLFEGRPMLFNHKEDFVSGHVVETAVTDDAMFFKGDLNPNAEMPNGVTIAEAVERGDINSVSIQAFVEPLGEPADEDGVVGDMQTEKAAVVDPLEISPVSIPGFEETGAMPEHLRDRGVKPVSETVSKRKEVFGFDVGDFLMWEFGGGESQGEVIDRSDEEGDSLSAGGNTFSVEDSENPLYKIQEWDEDAGEDGEFTNNVVKFEDALTKVDRPDAAPSSAPRSDEKVRENGFDDYPDAAVENARMALQAREDTGNPNDCLTRVGWERANQLDNREDLSAETVARMAAFRRHEDNKEQGEEGRADCGWMAWKAWGGDEGIAWAERKVEDMEAQFVSESVVGSDDPVAQLDPLPTHTFYESEADARDRADQLGLEGVHSHSVDGEEMFMPGDTHEAWTESVSEQGLTCPFPFDDFSECEEEMEGEVEDAAALCAEWVRKCKGKEPGSEDMNTMSKNQDNDDDQDMDENTEQVSGQDFDEFVASHQDGADVADVREALDAFDFTGLDLREVAALVADDQGVSTGEILESFSGVDGVDIDMDESQHVDDDDGDDMETENVGDVIEKQNQKLEEFERRLEALLDEDEAQSKQGVSDGSDPVNKQPTFKDSLPK